MTERLKSTSVEVPPAEQIVAPAPDALDTEPAAAVEASPAEPVAAPALDALEPAPAATAEAPPAEQIVVPALDALETTPAAAVGLASPAEQVVVPALDALEPAPAAAVEAPPAEPVVTPAPDALEPALAAAVEAPPAEPVVVPAPDALEPAPAAAVEAPPAEPVVAPAPDALEPAPAAAVETPPAEPVAVPVLDALEIASNAAGDPRPGLLKFTLDDRYRLPTTTWSAYLDHILSAVQNDVEELQASITVYVAIALAPGESEQDRCVEATLASIRAASSDGLVNIRPVALGKSAAKDLECYPSARELAERISGERTYVLFLKAGDEVSDAFAAVLARGLNDDKELLFFDMWQRSNDEVLPILLPGANPILALNKDYFYSRFLISGSAIKEESANAEVKTPYDLALGVLGKAYEAKEFQKYGHLPFPMICLPGTEAVSAPLALSEPFRYRFPGAGKHGMSKSEEEHIPSVSVVICTRNKGQLLFQLVTSILNQKNSLIEDVVIVTNNTDNPIAIERHRILSKNSKVKFVDFPQPFNFSAQSNLGARNAKGNSLLFLNDDIVPVTEDWVAELLRPLESERIAMAGALLLYPNEQVQHAGMFLGFNGVCGHTLRHAALPEEDYCGLLSAPRNVSCTTGACQMIKRDVFEELNGFDEIFATYIQDVDLCLRVRESGYDIAWTPSAVLLHVESPSVKEILADNGIKSTRQREREIFAERWGRVYLKRDPFHNPNFFIDDERLREIV